MIISSMTITAERNLRIAFVGPYFISGQSILTTKAAAMGISSPADVNKAGFSIAVPRGTTTEMIAKNMLPKADRVPAASTDEALKMLVDGKVKAMMADFPFVTVEAIRYRDKGLVSKQPLTSEPLGIAVRPNDPLLVNFLENLLGTMRGNGLLNALTQRWFKETDWMADLP
jgi:polar amino acid transport system substrate-binding protein